jgi:hypothetical protein
MVCDSEGARSTRERCARSPVGLGGTTSTLCHHATSGPCRVRPAPAHITTCSAAPPLLQAWGSASILSVERVKAVRVSLRGPGHLEVPLPGVAARCRPALSNVSARQVCAVGTALLRPRYPLSTLSLADAWIWAQGQRRRRSGPGWRRPAQDREGAARQQGAFLAQQGSAIDRRRAGRGVRASGASGGCRGSAAGPRRPQRLRRGLPAGRERAVHSDCQINHCDEPGQRWREAFAHERDLRDARSRDGTASAWG